MTAGLVHRLLEQAADQQPESVALVDGDRALTYKELDVLSTQVARALQELGVTPADRVGIYLEKSIEAVAGLYGVMKAGAAYVPLDPQAPAARLGYIAGNAGISCLVTSSAMAAEWPRLIEAGAPLTGLVVAGPPAEPPAGVTAIGWADLAGQETQRLGLVVDEDDLAYILYTSGSTGEPKGVMLSHLNALAFVEWAARDVGIGPGDRVSSHAPFHFDLSTFDLFSGASGGGTVVLVPSTTSVFPIELARFIAEAGITVWYSVPSILTMLVLRGSLETAGITKLRTIIFAGEVFPPKYLAQLQRAFPHGRFLNYYGPTETNVCTWYDVPPLGDAPPSAIPIGVAIPGVTTSVLDEDGKPVPVGEMGELYITGPTVMHGYWADPERSARALSVSGGERRYRTGDLVREAPDGNLDYVGRRDAQIKSRGYRIELGEIENALNSLDRVVECAVVAIPDELITNRIKAFVVGRDGLAQSDLVAACSRLLPKYMIPDTFDFHDALPKSSTGKIDRMRLVTEEHSRADR